MDTPTKKINWSSQICFIAATIGSAIGLGNIWRFPYIAGNSGGGAFLIFYIILMIFVGIPLLMSDFVAGRYSGNHNILKVFYFKGKPTLFSKFSYIYIVSMFLLLSYYFIIVGWVIFYIVEICIGGLNFSPNLSTSYYKEVLDNLLNSPIILFVCTFIAIVISSFINIKGINNGIERFNLWFMPVLFIILIILAIRSVTLSGSYEGIKFFFSFSNISFKSLVSAFGQTFFSLTLGIGVMMVYASYLKKDNNLLSAATITSVASILIGIIAGLAIIPATFALGYNVDSGPSLVFITFPSMLTKISFGTFFALLLFISLLVAAISTTISVTESMVPVFVEKLKLSRNKSIIIISIIISITSIPQILSLNLWSNISIFGNNIFNFSDYFLSNILLPIGGVLSCIFTAFIANKLEIIEEVRSKGALSYKLAKTWLISIRVILPFITIVLILTALGLI